MELKKEKDCNFVHGDYLLRCLQEARHPAGNEEERLGVCLVDLVPLVVVTAPAEVCCITSAGARASTLQLARGRHTHGAVKHDSGLSSI
jgi:hypothetical protein